MRFPGQKSDSSKQDDWVISATDFIERTVDGVRDKAVVPLTTIARAIVYGTLGAILGVSALVLFSILLVRFLDVYLDNIPYLPEGVWMAYLVAGLLFILIGIFAWSQRSPKPSPEKSK